MIDSRIVLATLRHGTNPLKDFGGSLYNGARTRISIIV